MNKIKLDNSLPNVVVGLSHPVEFIFYLIWKKEINLSVINITNYFSFLIKSKKNKTLSVILADSTALIKHAPNTITEIIFLYIVCITNIFMKYFCYI